MNNTERYIAFWGSLIVANIVDNFAIWLLWITLAIYYGSTYIMNIKQDD